jgi:hypothetical protein
MLFRCVESEETFGYCQLSLTRRLTMARSLMVPVIFVASMALFGATGNAQNIGIAIEYYHGGLDHYFITASASEINELDGGVHAGWQRTGASFTVSASSASPVCRFYIPAGLGDSHFYSASPAECQEVHSRFPAFILETSAAFHIELPDPITGSCPRPTPETIWIPVYRLWNQRADSNHRYTTAFDGRNNMISRGWLSEGYGPTGTAMCTPTKNDSCAGCWDY